MTAPGNVLACYAQDTGAFRVSNNGATELAAACAAVAELIEAANRALPELASKAYADADDMGAHEALRAALARVGGAP